MADHILQRLPQTEVERLREENQILQGKIRGYLTLGSLYREQKEAYTVLETQHKELISRIRELELSEKKRTGATSPLPVHRMAEVNLDRNVDREKTEAEVNGFQQNAVPSDKPLTMTSVDQATVEMPKKPSIQGATYPPDDNSQDKYPMQESLELENRDVHENISPRKPSESVSSSSIEKIDHSKDNSLGSYIFGDNVFDAKEGAELKRQVSVKATFGSSSLSHCGSLNLMQFPSAVSGQSSSAPSRSQEIFEPPVHVNGVTRNTTAVTPESSSPDEGERALSIKITEVAEALDLTTDGPAEKIRKFLDELVPEITKQEEEAERHMKQNKKLHEENETLKEERKLLLQKIQRLESQVNNVTPVQSMKANPGMEDAEWEKVPRVNAGDLAEKNSKLDLERLLAASEENNRKLTEANTKWHNLWIQTGHGIDAEELKLENEQLKNRIAAYEKQDEKRQQEFDKILLTAKQAQNQAEACMEDLQRRLDMTTVKLEAIEVHRQDIERQCHQLQREKQALEVEINIVKGGDASLPHGSRKRSENDIRTENAVLREQLKVFQEDFERERTDRAQAQATKDDLQKKLESEKQEVSRLKKQIQNLQRQQKNAEDNVKGAYKEIQGLQQENSNLKTQIRRERATNMYQPFNPVGQTAGYHNHQGGQLRTHQESHPFEGPVPPYMFNSERHYLNGYGQEISNRQAVPPEQMPGSWNCPSCTYYNHPRRTVCEMCGYKYTGPYVPSNNLSQPLMPRGEPNVNLDEANDLCIDSGKFGTPDH